MKENHLLRRSVVVGIILIFVGINCISPYSGVSLRKDTSAFLSKGTPINNNNIDREEESKGRFNGLATQESRQSISKHIEQGLKSALPTSDYQSLYYYNGECTDAIGLTNGGILEGAIRLTPTELAPYNGEIFLTVGFYHGCPWYPQPSHSGQIKIYGQGNETTPGALLTTDRFTAPQGEGWVDIWLRYPVRINASHDYWISIEVAQDAGEYPLGVDSGPAVDGKGGWIYFDGTWSELQSYNLCIYAELWGSDVPRPYFTWTPPDPFPQETILFNASESVGTIVLYEWDWNNDEVYEESSTTPLATHSWAESGLYRVGLRVTDDFGATAKMDRIVPVNHPPEKPTINGPPYGEVNQEYTFSLIHNTDPDGDSMYCQWRWGDGNITDWLGPYSSGEVVYASHNWSKKGTYKMQVRLKDKNGFGSNWSDVYLFKVYELKKAFIFGRYTLFSESQNEITIVVVNLWEVDKKPFLFAHYPPGAYVTFLDTVYGRMFQKIGFLFLHVELTV